MATTEILPFGEIIAMAPPSGQPGGSGLMSFLPMILIFFAFYFLLIRPQRQKQKQHEKMVQALEKGAKVKTTGGMFGTITGVKDDCFVIRIAENVKVEISKEAISAKID
jgi:preprotein translocase subunit YajC